MALGNFLVGVRTLPLSSRCYISRSKRFGRDRLKTRSLLFADASPLLTSSSSPTPNLRLFLFFLFLFCGKTHVT